jgi:hypothetical protein
MPRAVEAAKLRLWLQLAIDGDAPCAESGSRPLLPDLSGNLRCGDSLMQGWSPSGTDASSRHDENHRVAASRPQALGMADTPPALLAQGRTTSGHVREHRQASDFLRGRRFDIVIGNPPYVRHEKIHDPRVPREKVTTANKRQYKAGLAASLYRAYPLFFGASAGRRPLWRKLNAQSDLYVYFYFRCLSLLNEKGTCCLLTSNSWLDVAYGAALQEFLLRQCHVKLILDNQARRSFASAGVNTVITLLSPPASCPDWGLGQTARFVTLQVPFERALSPLVFPEIEAAGARKATPAYRVFPVRQDRLLQDGCELPEEENVHASGATVDHPSRGPSVKPARYVGGKWGGQFLRAPEVFHRVREIAGRRLVPLGRLGKIRYPIKTGINDFFYLDESRRAAFDIDPAFLVRVVKSPREFRSIRLHEADLSLFLFACPLSRADLEARGCRGTLEYIEWGARQKTVARQKSAGGVPWPQVPSVRGRPQWYSIAPLPAADVICNRFFHDRFFFGCADFPVVEDQTFYGCTFTIPAACRRAQIALLNSTLQFLFVELLGRVGLGEGVLQYATYEMAQMLTLDARQLTERQRDEIARAFAPLADRPLARLEQEIASSDRRSFDDCVFDVLGLTQHEREAVYEAVVHLVDARLKKAESLLPRRRSRGNP